MEQDFFLAGAMFGAGFFLVGGFAMFVGWVFWVGSRDGVPEERTQLTREVRLQRISPPKRYGRVDPYLDHQEKRGRESA